jgi:hypothetical protein
VYAIVALVFAILLVISPIWLTKLGSIRVAENHWIHYEFGVGEIVEMMVPGAVLLSPAAYAFIVYIVRAQIDASQHRRNPPPAGATSVPPVE